MTDKLREAAQQALEALEGVSHWVEMRPDEHPWDAWQRVEPAITALRAALAEQPAEQVTTIPPGCKLVPVEPTLDMSDAGGAAVRTCYTGKYDDRQQGEMMCDYIYRKMLAAAPEAPQPAKPAEQPVVPTVCIACGSHDGHHQNCARVRWGVDTTTEAPQPAKQPLTDEELGQIINANWGVGVWQMARAIEAAHGIIGETK